MLKLGDGDIWSEKFCTVGKSWAGMRNSTMDRARAGSLQAVAWTTG